MARLKTMVQLIDIVKRLKMGESMRGIQRETGTHRKIVRKVRNIAEGKGWLENGKDLPSESEINEAYPTFGKNKKKAHSLDIYKEEIKRYIEQEYTFVIIHKLISEKASC